MKFKVASGKIKECIQNEHGHWVTPKKRWYVAREVDGEMVLGGDCEVYVEEPVESDETSP